MTRRTSVLVLRKDKEFAAILRAGGLDVTEMPLISTEPIEDLVELEKAIERLDEYDGAIITSVTAARIFADALSKIGKPIEGKIYVLGGRANAVFESAGIETVFDDDAQTVDDMIDRLGNDLDGKKLLFVRGEMSLRTVPERLKGRSVVDEVIVYRTLVTRPEPQEREHVSRRILGGEVEWLCFFSPSAVEAFHELFGDAEKSKIAAIGTTTAKHARDLGYKVEFISPRSNSAAFASSFLSHLNGN